MKNKILSTLSATLVLMAFLFVGCQNNEKNKIENNASDKLEVEVFIEVLNVQETAQKLDHYLVTIGFSPIPYRLNKEHEKASAYFSLIKDAFRNKMPLKVNINKKNYEVISIEEPSEVELNNWKATEGKIWNSETHVQPNDIEDLDKMLGENRLTTSFTNYAAVVSAFNFIKTKTCDNNSSTNQYGCIPFAYKRDGCYARAHRMRELIESNYSNKTVFKLFVYADSPNGEYLNIPGCPAPGWTYHVAPIVYAAAESTWYVLDPSLNSNVPLTFGGWYSYMGASNICDTDVQNPEIYGPYQQGCNDDQAYVQDNAYSGTYGVLNAYQNRYGCF